MKWMQVDAQGGALRMSKTALGTMDFGTAISQEQAFALMDRYVELGGNVIDTARVYGDWVEGGTGASEKVVGAWLRARGNREQIVLVTKGGHPRLDAFERSRLDRDSLHGDLALSLEALGVPSVDIYFLHLDDPALPVGPIIDALDELVQAGKIRALGASNWSWQRISQANEYARAHGKTPFTVSQIQWSLAACTPETWGDTTLVCMNPAEHRGYQTLGLPVMAYTPQARGVLPQLIANGPEGVNEYAGSFVCPLNIERAARLKEYCGRKGLSPSAVCMAYITSDAVPGCAIIGTSRLDHLEDTMQGADLTLSADEAAALLG